MTATAPTVLFQIPDHTAKYLHLPRQVREFVLHDDPEDTQAAIAAHQVREQLDAEAGSILRFRLSQTDEEFRALSLVRAERVAAIAAQLADALQDLNSRWSSGRTVDATT